MLGFTLQEYMGTAQLAWVSAVKCARRFDLAPPAPPAVAGAVRAPGRPSSRAAWPAGPVQPVGALSSRSGGEDGLEQLPNHPESVLPFDFPAPRPQNTRSSPFGADAGGGQQRGLADPGGPPEHQRASPARTALAQDMLDPG